jgi:exopolyphosphatase / guanosine-5'-triphosphate,3'-diphosphate pyrophosphatase
VTTIAAIDCGTNTIKLLIGQLPDVVVRETRMVRLGQGVDRTGRISEEALARAFAAVDEYAALVGEHDVGRIRFCATSATRDAANGDEEAVLAFDGAVRHLQTPPETPVMVLDIGGGSTELVLGVAEPDAAHSMDVGSVRLHERHLHDDPPSPAQVRACTEDIDAALDESAVDPASAATVVGVAGTILSVVAGVLDLPAYDRDVIDQSVVAVAQVHDFVDRLVAMPLEERLALPWMHPGRADVIDAGALILSRVLRRTRVESMVACEADILDGIAWSIAG